MNLTNALSLLLQTEAKRPARETALFNTTVEPRNSEHFPTNDTWWKTGSLCVAMLHHNPSVVTIMIVVGARANKRYAITAEPTPVLVEFSTNDMKELNMRVAKTSTEKDHKLFVTEPCANGLRRGTRIVPLRTEYITHAFNEANEPCHPHEFYQALKDIKTPGVKMIQAWAKAAALKTGTDAVRSAIELRPRLIPQFEDNLAHQMASDIKDAFIEDETDHEEFVDSLLKAIYPLVRTEQEENIPPTTAATATATVPEAPPPPPPTTEVDPEATERSASTQTSIPRKAPAPPATEDYDSDEVEDVTPAGANRPRQDRNLWQELSNNGHKRQPNPLSPGSEQRGRSSVHWEHNNDDIDCPRLRSPHDRYNRSANGFMDNADNDISWTSKRSNRYNTDETWTSNSRDSYNHMRRPATNHFGNTPARASSAKTDSSFFNTEQSSGAALKLKQLTDIAIHRPLSTQEMNQWKVLHASAAVDTPATSDSKKNFLGMQQFSILAWANTHPEDRDYLNKNNDYFWPKLNACKNKSDARLVVETEMFQPLLRRNPKLINCLHDELKETIVNFRFKPNNLDSDKPTLGLGPLAFVPRERREIEMMSRQITINDESMYTTTSDIDKTKLGRPKLPTSVDGFNSVIEACKDIIEFLYSDRCAYVKLLHSCLLSLYENHHTYDNYDNFSLVLGAEILFQLTRAAEQFFGQATSEYQLLQGRLPTLKFDFLTNGIRNNNLNTSQSRPPIFVPTQKKPRVPPPAPRTNRGSGGTGGGGNNKGSAVSPPSVTPKAPNKSIIRQLCTGMSALIVNWKTAHARSRMPSISDFRKASDIADDAALQELLSLNKTTCIRWALLGSCRSNCKREHPATIAGFNETAAQEILRKGLPE